MRREALLQAQIDHTVAAFDNNYERQLRYEMEITGKPYVIEKSYADAPAGAVLNGNATSDIGLVEVVLKIFLEPCDWYKIQSQSFYQELIRYLDNLKTQKTPSCPEAEQNSKESSG